MTRTVPEQLCVLIHDDAQLLVLVGKLRLNALQCVLVGTALGLQLEVLLTQGPVFLTANTAWA
jgi:hypothetical protein